MTLKKSNVGHLNPLGKGMACESCKSRKVRCDGVSPACASCIRSAKFEHRDPLLVCCQYKLKLAGISGGIAKPGKKEKSVNLKRQRSISPTVDQIINTNQTDSNRPYLHPIITEPLIQLPYCSYPSLQSTSTSSHSVAQLSTLDSPYSSSSLSFEESSNIDASIIPYQFEDDYAYDPSLDQNIPFPPSLWSYNFQQLISQPQQLQPFQIQLEPQPSIYALPSLYSSDLDHSPVSSGYSTPLSDVNHEQEKFTDSELRSLPPPVINQFEREDLMDGYFGIDGYLASGKASENELWTPSWSYSERF